MKKSVTISVVIPAYNEEYYLADCLDSIKKQTIKPDEVIVVDNNSTDKTAEIAKKYPFVKIIKEPKQGLVFARTAGLDAATGGLLVRLDADARLQPDWLENLAKLADRYPDAAGFTGRGTFNDMPLPGFFGLLQVLIFQYLQFPAMRGHTLWGAAMAVRSKDWRKAKPTCHFRNDIDEDIDLTLQLKKSGQNVIYSGNLRAEMSLLHHKNSWLGSILYISSWPFDYVVNKRPIAALYISVITLLTVIWASLFWLCLRPFVRL